MIVDAHCHASTRWYEPVETLLFNMDRCGVDKAMLIPLLGSLDNDDMIAAVGAHPDRLVFFAAVDPGAADATDQIQRAYDSGALGLRMRPAWRSGAANSMAMWEKAQACNLLVSLVGPASSFVDGRLLEVADHCPGLTLLMEHLGGLARPDVGDRAALIEPVCALASRPNVAIKLPGLGQLAPRTSNVDATDLPFDLDGVEALVLRMLDRFGSGRMMWGSDFPPVAAREGYAHALQWMKDLLAVQRADESHAIFGGTAAKLIDSSRGSRSFEF